jgi:hypothetical protein
MTFRYHMVFPRRQPGQPRGLFAYNPDDGRLDMIAFNHLTRRWEHDPEAVTSFLFGGDQDCQAVVTREQAEEIARTVLGTTLPPEAELMAISDQAERERARRYGNKLPEGWRWAEGGPTPPWR